MTSARPIYVLRVWGRLQEELLALLQALSPEDWARPVPDSRWTVKDVAAHLLDGDMRRLSLQRDGAAPPPPEAPITSPDDLVRFLNRLNADWLRAAQRLSPRVIVELLAWSGPRVERLFASLDPEGEAFFPVAWAGEESSRNWMDVAREYTEKWVHQQQIRDAVGRPGPPGPELLRPVIATFLHAVPPALGGVEAADGAVLAISITGEAGGEWAVRRGSAGWKLAEATAENPTARVRVAAEAAWRLLATRRHKARHRDAVEVEGDPELAGGFLAACAIMA